jgi:excinuclease ABC subunit A
MEKIRIRGARVNNLKNVDLDLPIKKLTCFVGPSGSGKTSIAFHTLLTESKRRFINSFPSSMKFFIERPTAVEVDEIFPVLPVFGLPQINPIAGSRATVADVVRLTDNIQNLFYNFSNEYCPEHKLKLTVESLEDQFSKILKNEEDQIVHLLVTKLEFQNLSESQIQPIRSYYSKNKTMHEYSESDELVEVFRFKSNKLNIINEKFAELRNLKNLKTANIYLEKSKKLKKIEIKYNRTCPKCGHKAETQRMMSMFSPYTALGACLTCKGYGANLIYDEEKIINPELSVNENGIRILKTNSHAENLSELKKILSKKKISLNVPIKNLGKDFIKLAYEGHGNYYGINDLIEYLEKRKYKPQNRIFLRNIQKEEFCTDCNGSRLNQNLKTYYIEDDELFNMYDLSNLSIAEIKSKLTKLKPSGKHFQNILKDAIDKLNIATDLGLNHLNISRKAKSLSAGEYQRLLLIKYLSFKGTDSLFVLDEPSLGLSQFEQKKLILSLKEIVNQGNTVILIDHADLIQKSADYIVEMGPQSGVNGGEVIFEGESEKYFKTLNIKSKIKFPEKKNPILHWEKLEINQPEIFGKKYSNFTIPKGELTWVRGNSGSGKSAVIVKTVAQYLYKKLFNEDLVDDVGNLKSIKGKLDFNDVIVVDSNLNRFTSRSSVGSLTELAPALRKHFLKLPISKEMNLKEGHLSSNSDLGMCPVCEGKGVTVIEMQYLEDVILKCEECNGLKMKSIYANISDGYMTVAEAYTKPLNEVLPRINLTPKFRQVWEYLKILNLDYLSLDRAVNSLSGGEKQRIFLLSKMLGELKNSLIVFENLSFGLSAADLARLMTMLQSLVSTGNTILIIDSDPLLEKFCDFQIIFDENKITTKIT